MFSHRIISGIGAVLATIAIAGSPDAEGADFPNVRPFLEAGIAGVDGKPRSKTSPRPLTETHRGIRLSALAADAAALTDSTVYDAWEGMTKLHRALETIYAKSPISAAAIDSLKRRANVVIVYAPTLPRPKAGEPMLLAAYLPAFYDARTNIGDGRNFVTVITPDGLAQSTDELAGTLVHELVGHAGQHMNGYFNLTRRADMECEAELHQGRFLLDVGLDEKSPRMRKLGQRLAGHCEGFGRHLRERKPADAEALRTAGRDLPRLLAAFRQYVGSPVTTTVAEAPTRGPAS